MRNFFTVLGGMGTAATESYVRMLNARTPATRDQDFLDYILVNHATVPDRTAYILDHTQENFFPDLAEDITQQALLNPKFMVIVCNTAHYFYDELAALTPIPLLHMPRIAVNELVATQPQTKRVGLIATAGTIADHVYEDELKQCGIEVTVGDKDLQAMVNTLIYDDIKTHNRVDPELFHKILTRMRDDFNAETTILGCTELSLANELAPQPEFSLVDPQSIIVDKTLALGLAFRESEAAGQTMLDSLLQLP